MHKAGGQSAIDSQPPWQRRLRVPSVHTSASNWAKMMHSRPLHTEKCVVSFSGEFFLL